MSWPVAEVFSSGGRKRWLFGDAPFCEAAPSSAASGRRRLPGANSQGSQPAERTSKLAAICPLIISSHPDFPHSSSGMAGKSHQMLTQPYQLRVLCTTSPKFPQSWLVSETLISFDGFGDFEALIQLDDRLYLRTPQVPQQTYFEAGKRVLFQ
jgi:hypothetical protein